MMIWLLDHRFRFMKDQKIDREIVRIDMKRLKEILVRGRDKICGEDWVGVVCMLFLELLDNVRIYGWLLKMVF